jgi:hypothetical protein
MIGFEFSSFFFVESFKTAHSFGKTFDVPWQKLSAVIETYNQRHMPFGRVCYILIRF